MNEYLTEKAWWIDCTRRCYRKYEKLVDLIAIESDKNARMERYNE